ncbi:cobalamin biosynthesis protein CobN [Intrasporangium chromatireducens Q5-1]|uniref:Cobalamin biosynthesis protein CobN n=1 Tax=Intrasporangium chromatireducens Q5-1 TaxID=584657 RepID=W9GLV3_9MICO|nr:cobaltochelatase subunit CobN [Intrasporangium chromatireducens]EWT07055.1 cobalamin biosynthesis protein CobN [Intrasporangium chromatireducens Q5-1]
MSDVSTRILLLSTSDTDLLGARASGAAYRWANPTRVTDAELRAELERCDLVVFRYLGSVQSLPPAFAAARDSGRPFVVLGGEQTPDASLMELSSVPLGVAAEAHRYLAQGGATNLRNLHAFLADTVLLSGDVFDPPADQPTWGLLDDGRPRMAVADHRRALVAILYYRAHHLAGNVAHVRQLSAAVEAAGGVATPIFVTSLRDAPSDLLEHLQDYDVLVTTVLAAGGTRPAAAAAGEDDDSWDVEALAELDVPIIQGLTLTWDRSTWQSSDDGMSPLDVTSQVAVPEFDGRIIGTVFSFKEIDADGLPQYVPDVERCRRLAELAVAHGRLRHTPPEERRIAIVLSAYPTKHARIGNAVGLDTPVSVIRLLRALRTAGYDLGEPGKIPGTGEVEPVDGESVDTTAGNALIHAIIEAGGQDEDWLTQEQLSGQPVRIPAGRYREFFATLPAELREAVTEHWGDAPGELFVDRQRDPNGEIVAAALRAGNVVILVQPPRGFGANPIAIYHDPDLPPTHHYLAVYDWLAHQFGAHAIVHMGKHGNLEWLPGKNLALSASCGPDATIGGVPLVYPFLVNDPGEGSQAKRRAHATIVDHLVPPMARAESYGDIARLEQLLDEYGNVSAMDPAKAPALRAEIWSLLRAAELHRDLGLEDDASVEDAAEFDLLVQHVDGWLCEIKDVQIRDGLHVLGEVPSGQALVDLVLAILRARQVFAGTVGAVPGLRTALGLAEDETDRGTVDRAEAQAAALVSALADTGWDATAVPDVVGALLGSRAEADTRDAVCRSLTFACEQVVPRVLATSGEIDAILHALDGGYVPAGPSGSPLRGLVNVLPTGRNFYTVDPKAVPSRLAWETGQAMADSLLTRHHQDTGEWPRSVGLSVWGTSAMRTSGDDVAEVLALLGVRPVWDEMSRRVVGLQPIALAELGRPRIDVTVRISGFFRDAFPHVIDLLDDAVRLVAGLDEAPEDNFVRAHVHRDLHQHGDERRATMRIFGSKPGSYGAGILPLVEAGNWRDDKDLAEVYATWGGFAYGRQLSGIPARPEMERIYARIDVAAKNIDTREHDIADSDDYFQYHGGMVATVRALTGRAPRAYVGDSTTPESVRTRTLTEETARVFRARVVNPRWISGMRRHGYKGAFELAATVDYLFGLDATAGVVEDWMYENLARTYVLDKENQDFLRHANPWALHGMVERLHEAVDRGLWAEPDLDLLARLQAVYLEVEGDLEE